MENLGPFPCAHLHADWHIQPRIHAHIHAHIHMQVVVGTHGKLKAWASKRILSLDSVRILVFDEADEMLKVGHCHTTSSFEF